jgi:multidrug efflux pump subunit AcrA (membrane-fusion protein)
MVIAVLAVVVFFLYPNNEEVRYLTEVAQQGVLEQTVDATGEVVSIDEVELSFDLSGTVDQLLVAVGDSVEIGTILAILQTTELVADVQSAYQAVEVASANLAQQRAGAKGETLAISEAGLLASEYSFAASQTDREHASTLLDLTKSRYGIDANAKSVALTTATDNLSQTYVNNAELVADAYNDLLSAAWGAVIEARSGLGKADEVMGVRNGALNDAYETFLSSKNSSALTKGKTQYLTAESNILAAESSMLSVGYGSSSGSIVSAAEDVEDAIYQTALTLLYTRQVTEATLTGSGFSGSDLTALIATVDASRVALQVDQAALENAFQAVSDALSTSSANLEDAQNSYNEAVAALESSQALADYSVAVAAQTLSAAEASVALRSAELAEATARLAEVAAEPRTVDLASYEAEVERARAAYSAASARLEKAEISSPISGNVTEVSVEVGEQVVAATPVVVVQTTGDQFEIVAFISESDIVKIGIDDLVTLTFDAFSTDDERMGFVGEIDPAEKLIEGVVYYEVTVYLADETSGLMLRPGMSVDLVLETDRRGEAITLPQRAVLEDAEGKYVRVLVGGSPERVGVTTGLRGDLGRVEIVTGLEVGDEVVIREISE